MADISVIIDVLGAEDMEKAARVTQTLQNKVQSLGKQLQKGNITNRDYQRGVQQLIKKNQQHAGGYKNLQKDVQRYAGTLQRQVNDLRRAEAATELAGGSTTEYTSAIERNTSALRRQSSAVLAGGNQIARYDNAAQKAAQTTKRRFNTGLQQAGFQVGDFAVQLQSGTNAAVAFGQQGSQLLGIFGPLGALLGAGLAIGTAIVAPLIDANSKAGTFIETLEDLTSAISDYKAAAREAVSETTELNIRFGSVSESMRPFLNDLREIEKIKALEKLDDQFEKLEVNSLGFFQMFAAGAKRGESLQRELAEEVGLTSQEYDSLQDSVRNLKEAETTSDRIRIATQLRNTIRETVGPVEEMTDKMRAFYDSLARVVVAGGELQGVMEEGNRQLRQQVSHLAQIATIQEEVNAGVQSILSNRDAELQKQRDRIALARVAIQYGEDSVQYSLKQQEIEERILRGQLEEENIRGNIADEIVRAWREANTLEDAADNINSKLARMERLASSVTFHMMQGSEGAQMLEEYGGRGGRGSSDREPIFGDTGDSIYSDPTGSGGGASGTTQAEKLERARAAVDKLRASYDESYATKLKVADAQEKVNKLIALNPELTGMANSVLQDYIASLDQAEGPLQKIGNTMKDAFGNALMSIVDGTKSAKDAFKDMARAVLKQAYELLVIKPLMNSLFGESGGGGFFSSIASAFTGGKANGGVFGQSGEVTAYANGGVVSGAQMFTHQGGYGVMGEAGPEAIMPLKRGKNGKLGVQSEGGQQPVVIHQNFNFSANGDDSVKRIIQQEAPKIANYTQQQILDQRRRGGAMKSTFGG